MKKQIKEKNADPKVEEDLDYGEADVAGEAYNLSIEDILSEYDEEFFEGYSRSQARARLKHHDFRSRPRNLSESWEEEEW